MGNQPGKVRKGTGPGGAVPYPPDGVPSAAQGEPEAAAAASSSSAGVHAPAVAPMAASPEATEIAIEESLCTEADEADKSKKRAVDLAHFELLKVGWFVPSVAPQTPWSRRCPCSRLRPSIASFYDCCGLVLQVLGKGSFGKVLLVKKLTGKDVGTLYALKTLRKDVLIKRNQLAHTRTERSVLQTVDFPFLVTLRYAWQVRTRLATLFRMLHHAHNVVARIGEAAAF